MIVRMSKVEIVGPRQELESVLSLLQESAVLHIEPSSVGFIEKEDTDYIESFLPDKKTLSERIFLEDLKAKLNELFSYMVNMPAMDSYIQPRAIIDTISETLQGHLIYCRELSRRKDSLQKEVSELERFGLFLDAIEPLFEKLKQAKGLDFIGLTLRDHRAKDHLRQILTEQTDGKFELLTSTAPDGSIAGLIAVDRHISDRVKETLSNRDIPELAFPDSFKGLTFVEKMSYLKKRRSEISTDIQEVDMKLDSFSMKWGPIYKKAGEWVEDRLSVLKALAFVFETRMCFFIYGWMATENVAGLRERLAQDFGGKVLLEEMEVREEDLEKMPVILKNPAYFRPFELLTKILPLPRYTSYDPTPFIGIFFPLFFGMILGDAGYGILLAALSLVLVMKCGKNRTVQDAAKILFVASMYCVVFGILYGEFFGDIGHRLFGLGPLLVERRSAIMPMLYFALSVGVVHVLLGAVFGFTKALRRKTKKQALSKFLNILTIVCIIALVASLFGLFPGLFTRPLVLAILFITPFLLFTGGLLAPLELIKSIGNIISYARIMAIGLTSVLLAFVANRLAGMTGDIIVGTVVAGLLHLLNLVIGVFSPTIHSLRLHYVEFFSKFLESGGRRFEPLKKIK